MKQTFSATSVVSRGAAKAFLPEAFITVNIFYELEIILDPKSIPGEIFY